MGKNYGLPYQGSKSKIAEWVVDILPSADTLYDLFAGGCAITHCALLSGKYNKVVANDIGKAPQLFVDAVNGKYRGESRWISREEFEMYKDVDPYIGRCWSFGNNGRNYMYSRKLEPYKKAIHELLFAPTVHERRLKFKTVIREFRKLSDLSLTSGNSLQSLESLESLERLESLESLERLEIDYRAVEIAPDSVIYCDIPYFGTCDYGIEFDYDAFYDWCEKQTQPLYISEYWMPEDRFVCIAEKERRSTFSATNNSLKNVEKIFMPKQQYENRKEETDVGKRTDLCLFN